MDLPKVFGAVGLGGIARATIGLLASFKMAPPLAYDPYATPAQAILEGTQVGVQRKWGLMMIAS